MKLTESTQPVCGLIEHLAEDEWNWDSLGRKQGVVTAPHLQSSCWGVQGSIISIRALGAHVYGASAEVRVTLRNNTAQEDTNQKLPVVANCWKKHSG